MTMWLQMVYTVFTAVGVTAISDTDVTVVSIMLSLTAVACN